jgi:hypothetical protein
METRCDAFYVLKYQDTEPVPVRCTKLVHDCAECHTSTYDVNKTVIWTATPRRLYLSKEAFKLPIRRQMIAVKHTRTISYVKKNGKVCDVYHGIPQIKSKYIEHPYIIRRSDIPLEITWGF